MPNPPEKRPYPSYGFESTHRLRWRQRIGSDQNPTKKPVFCRRHSGVCGVNWP